MHKSNILRKVLSRVGKGFEKKELMARVSRRPCDLRLAVTETLVLFSEDRGVARRAFARFVAEGADVRLPENKQQLFLGDDDFAERMAARAKTPSREVPRKQRARKSLAQYECTSGDRNSAVREAHASGAHTLKSIGDHFSLHYATVCRIARKGLWQNKT